MPSIQYCSQSDNDVGKRTGNIIHEYHFQGSLLRQEPEAPSSKIMVSSTAVIPETDRILIMIPLFSKTEREVHTPRAVGVERVVINRGGLVAANSIYDLP